MATGEDAVRHLADISTKLSVLIEILSKAPAAMPAPEQAHSQIPKIATDADLDSQYGDPDVRAKSPRDWSGPSMSGRKFSECPSDYLELVASRLDYFSSNLGGTKDPEELKKLRYNRLDASRARGWAKRNEGKTLEELGPQTPPLIDDDIPF